MKRSLALVVLVLALASPGVRADDPGNGIVISPPKQYPYRLLEEQLADLDAQLAQIRAINAPKLGEHLGGIQGRQSRSGELSLSATELPTPKLETIREAGDDSALATTKETTTRESFTPTAPELTATLPGGDVSTVGLSAADLLEEQIQLQSQADSLRTILRRALSDRYFEENGVEGSRRIALVGFRVTLDPRRWHRNAAAVVELEVEHTDGSKKAPSLVALMPEEKTYNAVAVSKKSNAFSGAAIAGVFSIGVGGRRQSETLYVYQDADTFAFERPLASNGSTTRIFGWQFRPVLGKPSVEPGTRYLFAILALDGLETSDTPEMELKIDARSYWLDYRPKHRLARGREREPQLLFEDLVFPVLSSPKLQKGLSPGITSTTVSSIGEGNVLVKIEGRNLFRGSTVHLGSRALNGVVHRSDQQLEVVVPIQQVLSEELRITGGEFGFSTLVEDPEGKKASGLEVIAINPGAAREGRYRVVEVVLKHPSDSDRFPDLLDRDVFMTFGDEIFEIPFERWRPGPSGPPRNLVASVEVPDRLLSSDQDITVQIPFLGKGYEGFYRYHPPVGASRVIVLEQVPETVWGIVGHGFDTSQKSLKVFAGREYSIGTGVSVESPHLLRLSPDKKEDLASVKEVVVIVPGMTEPTVLRAPGVPAEKPKPKVTNVPTVAMNQTPSVEFAGEGFKQVEKVVFEGKEIPFAALSDEKLVVFVTRDVTKQEGATTLLGQTAGGGLLPLRLTVNKGG